MKIAYLLNQHPYASCTFIRREIHALEAIGLDVSRISIRPAEVDLADEGDRTEVAKTRVILGAGTLPIALAVLAVATSRPVAFATTLLSCMRLGWRSQRGLIIHLAYMVEACVLLRWLSRDSIEHVHAHFGTNATSVAMFCRLLGGPPYSFTVHGPREFDQPEALYLGEKTRNAAFVAAISSYTSAQLFRWCEYSDWAKIHEVHCGLSDLFLASPPEPLSGSPRFVCVGRLGEQKGIPILIEATRMLADRGVDFQLELVGDGELRDEIERLIQDHGTADRITLRGWASDAEVREYLRNSSIMVLPSLAEGLPVVIMESLALGRPVIVTAIAGIPELVEHGRCGWVVPSGSARALADAMDEALKTSPEELAAMGKAGRERVLRDHDASREARKLAELIHRYGQPRPVSRGS